MLMTSNCSNVLVSTVERLYLGCSVGEESSFSLFSLKCPGPGLRPCCSEIKDFNISSLPLSVQESGIRDLLNDANDVSMGFCL